MTRRARVVLFVAWGTVAVCLTSVAGDDECACGKPTFPEAAASLAEHGYPPDAYTVLLTWQEAPPGSNAVVTGYHVLPVGGSETFDLYSDAKGTLLDAQQVASLGIGPKNWNLGPIEQETKIPAPVAKSAPVRPVPVGPSAKVRSSASVSLPPLDVAALREEDTRNESIRKGPKRIGVLRDLPEHVRVTGDGPPSIGAWQTLADGGRLWSVEIGSPGAYAMRVHFAALWMPEGCTVIVYNRSKPVEAYGPYRRPYGSDPDVWTASCFSEAVVVECHVDFGTDVTGLKMTIDTIIHTYEDFGVFQWTKAAGSCNRDVSCYPDWVTTSHGICGYTVQAFPNQIYCTGALIADSDPDSTIPYFLTANHCVPEQEGQKGASTMEFYWLYQTPSCDGTPPALADVPRTMGGADFLAGASVASGTDFTLVRLRQAPPNGVSLVGWSTGTVDLGTQVTVIHHPAGDYKRISFGTTSNTGSPQNGEKPVQPYEYFHEILWHLGTTEHASSGGPLMFADRQLIVGQLWGGYASCAKPQEPDYFGRFDKTFPVVARWLDTTSDPYDVDKSGKVNAQDVQLVVNGVLGIPVPYNVDVDRSGAVDAVDVQLVIIAVLNNGQP